jgi:hypothetical protein
MAELPWFATTEVPLRETTFSIAEAAGLSNKVDLLCSRLLSLFVLSPTNRNLYH